MVVILLKSPLQPQFDPKIIPDKKKYKKASSMTGGFFYWQFNVGSISQMRNKETLSLFICKTSIMKFIT